MATTLKGSDVYSAIQINSQKVAYKSEGRMAGQFYHQARWGERGFTVSTEFWSLWNSGKIMQVTLDESTYTRINNATGAEETIDSARLMGFVPIERAINIATNQSLYEVAVAKADIQTKHARVVALKELNLDETSMQELMKAL